MSRPQGLTNGPHSHWTLPGHFSAMRLCLAGSRAQLAGRAQRLGPKIGAIGADPTRCARWLMQAAGAWQVAGWLGAGMVVTSVLFGIVADTGQPTAAHSGC
jgi:hypothetical protein